MDVLLHTCGGMSMDQTPALILVAATRPTLTSSFSAMRSSGKPLSDSLIIADSISFLMNGCGCLSARRCRATHRLEQHSRFSHLWIDVVASFLKMALHTGQVFDRTSLPIDDISHIDSLMIRGAAEPQIPLRLVFFTLSQGLMPVNPFAAFFWTILLFFLTYSTN